MTGPVFGRRGHGDRCGYRSAVDALNGHHRELRQDGVLLKTDHAGRRRTRSALRALDQISEYPKFSHSSLNAYFLDKLQK
jgi:hypothetical protein